MQVPTCSFWDLECLLLVHLSKNTNDWLWKFSFSLRDWSWCCIFASPSVIFSLISFCLFHSCRFSSNPQSLAGRLEKCLQARLRTVVSPFPGLTPGLSGCSKWVILCFGSRPSELSHYCSVCHVPPLVQLLNLSILGGLWTLRSSKRPMVVWNGPVCIPSLSSAL